MSRTESDRTESDLNPTSSFAPEICLGGEGRRRARGFAVFDPFVLFTKGAAAWRRGVARLPGASLEGPRGTGRLPEVRRSPEKAPIVRTRLGVRGPWSA